MDFNESVSGLNAVQYLHEFIDTQLILTDEERKNLAKIKNLFYGKPLRKVKIKSELMSDYGLYLCEKCGKYKRKGAFTSNEKICKKCLNKIKRRENDKI